MLTKKQARNAANWIFHETCLLTTSGVGITYASEIESRYQYDENPVTDLTVEDCETIAETIVDLYGIAILDWDVYEEDDDIAIDINVGTNYYENDEDDDESGDECWDVVIARELAKEEN